MGEQKELKPLHVRFAENEIYLHSREDDETDEDIPVRGRSSLRPGARTPRSPTPFCRQPLNIASDEDETEDDGENSEERKDVAQTSQLFVNESGDTARRRDKEEWHLESYEFGATKREDIVSNDNRGSRSARHSVRFAKQEERSDEFENTKVEKVTTRVPQSKGHVRSRRDPTPFVRRVYESSESEEDEIEVKSSKTDEGGTTVMVEKDSDEESGEECASEGEQQRHRVREISPLRDEVVQKERVPLRERFGVNNTSGQNPKARKRQVQFSEPPPCERDSDSNLKKVSSRRPTPVGPRGYTIDQEDDEDEVYSS